MSDSENPTPSTSIDDAKKTAGNMVATVMELKQSNPKVFFGGIAGVTVLLLILMSMGGSGPATPITTLKPHAVGQNYVLRGVNTTDSHSTVRMVQVPGSVAAFDDSEEDAKDKACNHLASETQVKALGFQDFAGKKDAFVNVEILSDGACKGRKGWVLAIDVQ